MHMSSRASCRDERLVNDDLHAHFADFDVVLSVDIELHKRKAERPVDTCIVDATPLVCKTIQSWSIGQE